MQDAMQKDWKAYAVASSYIAAGAIVAQVVNSAVPEPYLDEVFHVPQAQRYCQGQFTGYDAKLTTPPGLYIISLVTNGAARVVSSLLPALGKNTSCSTAQTLRQTTLAAQLALPWVLSLYSPSYAGNSGSLSSQRDKGNVRWTRRILPTSPMEAITRAETNPVQAAQSARTAVSLRQEELDAKRRNNWTGIAGWTLNDWTTAIDVHTVALLPPMWFFGFLYYTDIPSTLFVIGMFAAANRQRHVLAALLGTMSLTLRQTNVVWMLFALGAALLARLDSVGLDSRPLAQSSISDQLRSLASLRLYPTTKVTIQVALPYTPAFIASALFVMYNGSIVLGDREHHQVSTHWVQPFYFAAFATFFAWPTLLAAMRRVGLHSLIKARSVTATLSGVLVALAAIHYGSVAHPFLLADNRHYAFYLWRKVMNRTAWMRYALALPYAVAARAWWIALSQRYSFFWLTGFIVCVCAAIIPSPLIEPRYFMIPFIVLRLGLTPGKDTQTDTVRPADERPVESDERASHRKACLLEALWAISINVATLYLFVAKPFRWPESPGWQRFMW